MNAKIKQFIVFGICSVAALALCLVVLVVTVNNLDGEQSKETEAELVSKTTLHSSKDALASYFNSLVSETEGRFIKSRTYTDVSVNDLIVSEESATKESDEAILSFVKDKMLPVVDSYYSADYEGTFKDNNSKKLSLFLQEAILKKADYFVGQVDENGESVFDEEGNLVDKEFYYLTYELDGKAVSDNKNLSEMLSLKDDEKAKSSFIDDIKENCEVKGIEITPEAFILKAKVNRLTDRVEYINLTRNYSVTVDASFINKAELLGEKKISFSYSVTDSYEYFYAGIAFVENKVSTDVGEEIVLNVNAVIDNDSEYTIEFMSSDENIAKVDEMGYVSVLEGSAEPVTITVKLIYLGKEFTDTCYVSIVEE